jgi:alanine dehydrogenase
MKIGVPKEIKDHEYRSGMTPGSVREAVSHGHEVLVETRAGAGIGIADADYERAGARIIKSASEVFAAADMIVKVKEPQPNECRMLRPGQVLFTYLHLAPDPQQAELLVASGAIAIAYETVTGPRGTLPLLAPMSEVARTALDPGGRHCLEKANGGAACCSAACRACRPRMSSSRRRRGGDERDTHGDGNGARVTVLDRLLTRLQELDVQFGGRLNTVLRDGGHRRALVPDARTSSSAPFSCRARRRRSSCRTRW